MEYSTQVTRNIVKRGMRDLGRWVANYFMAGKKYRAEDKGELYGGWQLCE